MTYKFKAGDRIRFTGEDDVLLPAGSTGTVLHAEGVICCAAWDGFTEGHDQYGTEGVCSSWWVENDEAELIEMSETPAAPAQLQPMTRQVLEHLVTVGSISGIEAIGMYKVRSLTKQISMIRDAGYNVTSEWKRDATGQRYKRYFLSTEAVSAAA